MSACLGVTWVMSDFSSQENLYPVCLPFTSGADYVLIVPGSRDPFPRLRENGLAMVNCRARHKRENRSHGAPESADGGRVSPERSKAQKGGYRNIDISAGQSQTTPWLEVPFFYSLPSSPIEILGASLAQKVVSPCLGPYPPVPLSGIASRVPG